ncbi:unnamed protein product (macronuclear) [Paramecium tetraurelia]|uniref:Transmembrane protein n=1 Tax=Paramecium tetraurelia TaxID=5888 RepID=A0C1V1_PARTE|nr:uncharacterized protein GSPATT00034245001 [Paramecium tetraurelia]CAK64768.1 unnamed protein product [Paramecium tetraurelia]|eukprot:XP_001432165.1 hypothetical protein (macronuclear) [Paramecium tetraurelia strain d4-2]
MSDSIFILLQQFCQTCFDCSQFQVLPLSMLYDQITEMTCQAAQNNAQLYVFMINKIFLKNLKSNIQCPVSLLSLEQNIQSLIFVYLRIYFRFQQCSQITTYCMTFVCNNGRSEYPTCRNSVAYPTNIIIHVYLAISFSCMQNKCNICCFSFSPDFMIISAHQIKLAKHVLLQKFSECSNCILSIKLVQQVLKLPITCPIYFVNIRQVVILIHAICYKLSSYSKYFSNNKCLLILYLRMLT